MRIFTENFGPETAEYGVGVLIIQSDGEFISWTELKLIRLNAAIFI